MDRWLTAIGIAVIIIAAIISFPEGDMAGDDSRAEGAPPLRPATAESKDGISPLVALVLDDFGYSKKNFKPLKKLNIPVTLAVLPNVPHSGTACSFAKENGFEVILHMPMEPENAHGALEKSTITGDMDAEMVGRLLADAFRSVPAAKGLSNHMGSKATRNAHLMESIFADLKERNFFFLDSLTTDQSVCERLSKKNGIEYVKRDIFIDNELNEDYIERQLKKTEDMAFEKGKVVAIGHDRKLTVDVLCETVPEMQKRGVKFVTLSEMVKNKNGK